MNKFVKIIIELLLALAALGCVYGIVRSIAKPIKEYKAQEQQYSQDQTYNYSHGPAYPTDDKKKQREQERERRHQERERRIQAWKNAQNAQEIKLYSLSGEYVGSLGAAVAEWGGHTWFFFNGHPVHDPNCACGNE